MTKTEALCKLLALGGLTEPEAADICGWPRAELQATLSYLLNTRLITYINCGRGMRVYQLT